MNIRKLFKHRLVLGSSIVLILLSSLLGGCSSNNTQGAAPAAAAASQAEAAAAQRGYILIGIPSPSTGSLSGFGQATPWAENRVLDQINKDGGVYIKSLNKKLPVKLKVVDTESNPTKAAEVTSKLILEDKVNMLLVEHTPDTVNPVTAIAERYGIPTVALDVPVDAWLTGGPYKWSYLAFWTVDSVCNQYLALWNQADNQTDKTVGFLFPNDSDGTSWAKVFNEKLPAAGYKVVDPGRFPDGTKDFSTVISQFKQENVQIVTGTMVPPDFATFWKQAHQMGYSPKLVTVGKAYLFPSDAGAIGGNLAEGLTSEVWWSPYHPYKSSLTGESAKQLAAAWTKETGQQWTPPLGFDYAGMEIVVNVLQRAQSLNPETIRGTIGQTDLNTMVGHIKYNDKNYSETPLVGGQWTQGKDGSWQLQIINDAQHPEIPLTAKMIFPLPK